MPVRVALCCMILVAAGQLAGQAPVIAPGGIVNGASFASGPVAPGSIASIFGTNLAGSLASASSIPLSTVLGDVMVMVNGQAAPLYFAAPDQPGKPGTAQINFQVPFEVLQNGATGTATVVVNRTSAGSSSPATIQVVSVAPGILEAGGHAIAINNTDGTLAAPAGSIPGLTTHPAAIGSAVIVYATGLGAVTPAVANGAIPPTGQLSKTNVTPMVMVGGVQAQVLFSGLTPQFTGVNQINIVIPAGVTPGNAVPLQIQAGSITTSNTVTIAVSAQ